MHMQANERLWLCLSVFADMHAACYRLSRRVARQNRSIQRRTRADRV